MNGVELKRWKSQLREQPCANCGRQPGELGPDGKPDGALRIEADHVWPLARARELGLSPEELDGPDNLQPLCGPCNRYKSSWTPEELRARRFVEWREVLEDRPRGSVVEWPVGFDWDTGEWVDSVLTVESQDAMRAAHRSGAANLAELVMTLPREEKRTKADWVRGMLFDYPIRPVEEPASSPD